MKFEFAPLHERLAIDRVTQLAWLEREMGYSRDKTAGYAEKLIRLQRDPADPTSVYGFMRGYWKRFLIADQNRITYAGEQGLVARALQAHGKVVAGLCDKVAFSEWLRAGHPLEGFDEAEVLRQSLHEVTDKVNELTGVVSREKLAAFNAAQEFTGNPMGHAILGLHESYANDPADTASLRAAAIYGSAMGILMWQEYADRLAAEGCDVTLPQPGPAGSGGSIVPWDE